MHFSFKFIVLFISSSTIFKYGLCQRYEGDLCSLSSGGNGICKLISSCPAALMAIQTQHIFPKNCGFKDSVPIVCCATDSMGPGGTITAAPPIITISTTTKTTTRRIQTTPSTTTQKVYLKVGDKSREYCKEYEKFLFQPSGVIGVIGGPSAPEIDDCPIVAVENIVGGTPAKAKEFPHMALIGFEDGNNETHYLCGGSLISERFVLSAAHCTFLKEYNEPKNILLGDLELNSDDDDAEPQKIRIEKIIVHPKYTPLLRYHDIALFKLKNKPQLNTFTRPACLNTNPSLTNKLGVASGWGQTSYAGSTSDKMLKVTLDMFTNADCKKIFTRKDNKLTIGFDEETQLCAGSRTESKDTCQGDSGGPLQVANSHVACAYNIIGVTSFGKACGKQLPGVYTRVSSYIGWIEDIVWP